MSSHVVPARVYVAVFLALMVLTASTVWAATNDFGAFNTPVALAIAGTKALLVILFFMHAKYADHLTRLWIVAGFAFVAILLVLTATDYFAR